MLKPIIPLLAILVLATATIAEETPIKTYYAKAGNSTIQFDIYTPIVTGVSVTETEKEYYHGWNCTGFVDGVETCVSEDGTANSTQRIEQLKQSRPSSYYSKLLGWDCADWSICKWKDGNLQQEQWCYYKGDLNTTSYKNKSCTYPPSNHGGGGGSGGSYIYQVAEPSPTLPEVNNNGRRGEVFVVAFLVTLLAATNTASYLIGKKHGERK